MIHIRVHILEATLFLYVCSLDLFSDVSTFISSFGKDTKEPTQSWIITVVIGIICIVDSLPAKWANVQVDLDFNKKALEAYGAASSTERAQGLACDLTTSCHTTTST